jgi:hypothetical protein
MATINAIDSNIPIEVAKGGTGAATLTNHGVLVGSGTSAVSALSVGSTGQLLVGTTSSNPAFAASATGDFTFTSATASQTRTLTVSNTDNTAAATSAATVQVTVGGGNVGDPVTTYTVTGATSWTDGIDNSSSDSYKIAASTVLGTTDTFVMTTTGYLTMPLNAAFAAYNSGTQSSVTGDATVYTVQFDSEIFDQGSNFASNTFTAPVTGKYFLSMTTSYSNLGVAHTTSNTIIVTTGNSFTTFVVNGFAISVSGAFILNGSILVTMTAGDTATVTAMTSGGTKTVNLLGGVGGCLFSGYLAC